MIARCAQASRPGSAQGIYHVLPCMRAKFLFAGLFMIIATPSSAQRFEAEGIIEYSTASGRERYTQKRRFHVARHGLEWKIRTSTVSDSASARPPVLYNEAGCDGTNIFLLEQHDPKSVHGRIDRNTELATGRVTKTQIPPALESDLIYPLWLAYCSDPYLSSSPGFRLVAPYFPVPAEILYQDNPPGMSLPAECVLTEGNFPKRIKWFCEGKYMDATPEGAPVLVAYPPPYDRGFVTANFEAAGLTNLDGVRIPSGFSLRVLGPDFMNSGTTGATDLLYTILSKLEFVRKVESFSCMPELSGRTLIIDTRRYVRNMPIAYQSSSGWKSMEQITALMNNPSVHFSRSDQVAKRCCIIAAMIVSAALFLALSVKMKFFIHHQKAIDKKNT